LTINKTALIILDGWGIGNHQKSDAIYNASPAYFNKLMATCTHSTLTTFGNAVGLPEGQMGNSEVGHINLGAGRVIWQMLEKINQAFANNLIAENPVFQKAIAVANHRKSAIHVIGLLSDGGVHSSINHILKFIEITRAQTTQPIYVHAFLDGRDTDPKSGIHHLENLLETCKQTGAKLSSVVGRYYAMDRDHRWERTKIAYDLMVKNEGEFCSNILETIQEKYSQNITDEFMLPIKMLDNNGNLMPSIGENDVVFNLNFRTDRPRQLTEMLVERDFVDFDTKQLNVTYCSLTKYNDIFKSPWVLFEEENVQNTLGEFLASKNIGQLRAAETEKYPHVTFFFNGGREQPFANEFREMASSPDVATYDLKPEMSAFELTNRVIPYFSKDIDFMCVNFVNADMVGHTGVYPAIQKAINAVDTCLENIVEEGKTKGWQFVIIADHGNADFAINADGTPNTQHSLNPVPCILVNPHKNYKLKDGVLADIAPSILELMNLEKPTVMTGKSLVTLSE